MENQGSTWNKWDLHIHTPYSLFQCYGGESKEIWDKFIDDLENLSPEIVVIGINDYWFLEGYKNVLKYKSSGRLKNIKTIFPVCEFRIKKFAGVDFGKFKRINLHVIFSPDLSADLIQAQFLDTLQSAYSLDSENSDSTWAATITKDSLIDLGKQIRLKTPEDKQATLGSDIEVGFGNLNIDEERILVQIRGNNYLKGKCFLAIGKTEWADLKWTEGTIAEKKDIINKANFVFTCVDTIEEFNKSKQVLKNQNVRDLLLDCSDAHNFSNQTDRNGALVKERLGNVLTWIKSEPTFEGLRQILYEPTHRITISDKQPREPIRKIEKIQLAFPETIKIKKSGAQSYQDLCIRNIRELIFSPYFTCLIGGRGTGKSTIINLIAERLGANTDFFDSNQNALYVNQNSNTKYNLKEDVSNYITITGASEIEFVSQGKVEKLTDGEELTHLIFKERILQPNIKLQEYDQKIKDIIKLLDDQIQLITKYEKIHEEIILKTGEAKAFESVINSINDPTYVTITSNINSLTNSIASIDASKSKYENILKDIKSIIQLTHVDENIANEYEQRLKEIITYLSGIEEFSIIDDSFEIKLKSLITTENKRLELCNDLEIEKGKLSAFFTEKGTSQESINDSQSANENFAAVQSQIKALEANKSNLKTNIDSNKEIIDTIGTINNSSIKLIKGTIDELNTKLSIKDENVSPIRYTYNFNGNAFKNGLFEDFQTAFRDDYISNTSWPQVREVLFLIEPNEKMLQYDFESFSATLKDIISKKNFNTNNNYVKIVLNVFENKFNFFIYRYLVIKHLNNIFKYVSILGHYGKRELNDCSFGQKCTAVVVTLLMTGVKPLVIDEPEAHLDNRLIADYLVDLIKEKKSDRQIIFATHNANFVVNGDAELIHILEIPEDDNFTTITSTTIENTTHRDKLLKLEGGRDAFQKREGKLLIK